MKRPTVDADTPRLILFSLIAFLLALTATFAN